MLIGIPQLISPTKTKFVVEPDLVVLRMIEGCTSSKTIQEISETREIIHTSWRTNDITQGPHSNAGEVGRQRERKVELEGFLYKGPKLGHLRASQVHSFLADLKHKIED